MFIRECENCR